MPTKRWNDKTCFRQWHHAFRSGQQLRNSFWQCREKFWQDTERSFLVLSRRNGDKVPKPDMKCRRDLWRWRFKKIRWPAWNRVWSAWNLIMWIFSIRIATTRTLRLKQWVPCPTLWNRKSFVCRVSKYEAREAYRILKENGTPCLIYQENTASFPATSNGEVLPLASDNGVGFIGFSPLHRECWAINTCTEFLKTRVRRIVMVSCNRVQITPRTYLQRISQFQRYSCSKGQTLAQNGLVWCLHQNRWIQWLWAPVRWKQFWTI